MVDVEFTLSEGDALTKMLEGVPSITFSDRVKEFIKRRMAKPIIVKLLGGRIGFNALLNKISMLWNTQGQFQLMDLENDFYLVSFQENDNYAKVLSNGPWVVFGKYLTVSPWSPDFSTSQSAIESQVVWVRLLGLPEGYYSDCLLRVIGQAIGQVIKLDVYTDGGRRGWFARLAICVDLRKPLVSKLWINGKLQRVEYEGLPSICFKCGRVGHVSDGCVREGNAAKTDVTDGSHSTTVVLGLEKRVEEESFGSWMVVEWRKGQGRSHKGGVGGGAGTAGGQWLSFFCSEHGKCWIWGAKIKVRILIKI